MKRIIDRFMAKVEKTESCWLWLAATDRKGYGRFSVGNSRADDGLRRNSMVGAHRFSYESFVGPVPSGDGFHGTCVLHRCDNPRCVNPEHLFLGTNKENVRDMDQKGRRVVKVKKGSAHANSVLVESQVLDIYQQAISRAKPQAQIARDFGVCLATVNHIKTGRLWSHLTGAQR